MFFKCQNCGGNIVYNPDKGAMVCPHCEGEETQQKITGEDADYNSMEKCLNCGAPLKVGEFTSASQCEFCGHYLIFDERVRGQYQPKRMIPFSISKQKAKDIMQNSFAKKVFAPSDFLAANMLEKMTGEYVPFFLYDMDAQGNLRAEGTRVRTWVSGKTEYTETSFYDVVRDMTASFNEVPVDASNDMPDDTMDLMEPYDYGNLRAFREPDLSGFESEVYNQSATELFPRAQKKAHDDTVTMMKDSIVGYDGVRIISENVNVTKKKDEYALLPVWKYVYSYKNKMYTYFINGQTGKLVGEAPVSVSKVIGYGATIWALLTATLFMISRAF